MIRRPPRSTLLSLHDALPIWKGAVIGGIVGAGAGAAAARASRDIDIVLPKGAAVTLDRKSTRLNSSHSQISYAVFCLKKKKTTKRNTTILSVDQQLQHASSLY